MLSEKSKILLERYNKLSRLVNNPKNSELVKVEHELINSIDFNKLTTNDFEMLNGISVDVYTIVRIINQMSKKVNKQKKKDI